MPEHMHRDFGGYGGGWGREGWGGRPMERRVGYPLFGGGMGPGGFGGLGMGGLGGLGMGGLGGLGMGGGLGSSLGGGGLLGDLVSGGIGYLAGKSLSQNQQQAGQYQQYPQYQQQYQQPAPQYQQPTSQYPQYQQQPPPQYQQPAPQYPQYQQPAPQYQDSASQGTTDNTQNNRLAQLKLLGQLREQGTLTEDEFQAEKQKILNGQ